MKSGSPEGRWDLRLADSVLVLALLWLSYNLFYVYLARSGEGAYRVESAGFIFGSSVALRLLLSPRRSAIGKEFPQVALERGDRRRLSVLAALAALAVYRNSLRVPFLSDDYVFLLRLQEHSGIAQFGEFFRPFFQLVFHVVVRVFGASAVAFHSLSFLLHCACTFLVYLMSKKVFAGLEISYAVALVFLLSPIQPEAVLWVSGLQELLWVFFVLLASLIYLMQRELPAWRLGAVWVFLALALLTKETAVCFLPLFVALDGAVYQFRRGRRGVLAYLGFGGLLLLYGWARSSVVSFPMEHLDFPTGLEIKAFLSQPFNVFLFPWNQSSFGTLPPAKLLMSLLAAIGVCVPVLRGTPFPRAWLGVTILYIGLLPLGRMFYVGSDLQGSRYLYFSTWGWGIVVALVMTGWARRRRSLVAGALAVLMASAGILEGNLRPWIEAGRIVEALGADVSPQSVPDNHHGAYVFRNGYAEYRELEQRGLLR